MGFRGFIGYAKTGRYVGALVVLLCLWAQAAVAQNPIADSLLKQLRGETVDTNRVQLLRQLSYAYRTSEPDLALQYARNGRQLASLIDYPLGEAACLNSVGAAYMSVGNLPKALESFLAALQLNEQRGSQYGTAANLGNIGRVYALQGDFKAANRYGFRSRRLFEAIHDTSNVTMQLLNMGGNYAELGKPDSAMYYTQLGYARARQEDSKANLIISLNNLGVLYSRQNRNELALWSYQQAVPYCVELNQIEYLCTDYFNIAEVSGLLGRPDTLLHYGRRSLALAQRSGINNSVLDASALLSNYFEQQHRPDSAFRYLKLAAAANDSLHNQDRVQHVQQLTFAEKIRQQELREAREQAEGNRRYNLQLLAIAVFIFTFAALLVPLSRRLARTRVVEVLGLVALLMLFEFIALLAEPTIQQYSNNSPVLLLLATMLLALTLAPLHSRLEHWMKNRLLRRAARDQQKAGANASYKESIN